ncbi:MAG: hypothetical protein QNK37_08590 [Acidobacteriota bacterium]|nr:hypothetical protein [Acidobacteriota bacterium]
MKSWIKILVICALFAGSMTAQGPAPSLYIYLPSNIRPYIIQKRMETACPNLSITVYGHHRELDKAVKNKIPDAILALEPVTSRDHYDMFQPALYGTVGGKRYEELVLVSRDQTVDLTKISELRIGVVDILGRKNMRIMLARMLGAEIPNIKPVSRLEDLLSLLQVREADVILVPEPMVETYYKKRSRLPLRTNPIVGGAKMGLAVLAVREDISGTKRGVLMEAFKKMDANMNVILGVEQWEVP